MEELVRVNENVGSIIMKHSHKPTLKEGLEEILRNEINRKIKKYMIMIKHFESKYKMNFSTFEESHKNQDMSYESEKDLFDWDMAVTAVEDLNEELT